MLYSRVFGSGPALVFIHGFLESSTMWDVLPLATLKCQCIFVDLPGHGKSALENTPEEPSICWIAHQVISTLEALDISSFSIVGHSMGGYVALEIKRQMPACRKVVLLNSNFWTDGEQKKKDRVRVASLVLKAKNLFIQEAIPHLFNDIKKYEATILTLVKEAKKMDAGAIAFSSLAMRNRVDFSGEIIKNPADYLFIHGVLDRLVEVEEYSRKTEAFPEQLCLIDRAGHMSPWENPTAVMNCIKSLL
jgi:pimeloyl-ACP methyl ester carboxylesterase